jgi:flagellar biosynthesis protein FliQ
MTDQVIITVGQEALKTAAMVGGPILLSALIVGIAVSVFQAVTQINEATLTFIPKVIVIGIILVVAGPWMMDIMNGFTIRLFENITTYVRE